MWAHLLGLQIDDQLALLVAVSDVVCAIANDCIRPAGQSGRPISSEGDVLERLRCITAKASQNTTSEDGVQIICAPKGKRDKQQFCVVWCMVWMSYPGGLD